MMQLHKIVNPTYDAKEVLFQLFPETTLFFTVIITRGTGISPNLDATQAAFLVCVIPFVVHLRAAFWTQWGLCSTKNCSDLYPKTPFLSILLSLTQHQMFFLIKATCTLLRILPLNSIVPVASILGLQFFFNYRKRRKRR